VFSAIPKDTATGGGASRGRPENGDHGAQATTGRQSTRDPCERRADRSAYSRDSQSSKL